MANFLDELKKSAQRVGSVALTSGVQNALEDARQNAIQKANAAAQKNNTVYSPSSNGEKQTLELDANNQQERTDWVAEYDKVMYGGAPQASSRASVGADNKQQANVGYASQQNAPAVSTDKWQADLDGIMNQIMNREKFSYDMNGDAMYQQYADTFKNQANRGMENAMAQAAAMTGGYGSSYAQMVGQQAYAQEMQGLNEIGMDLYDRAFSQYQAEGDQLAREYAMLSEREQKAYDRSIDERNFNYQKDRDSVADDQWERQFASDEEQRGIDNDYRNRALDQDNQHFYAGLEHDVRMQDDVQEFQSSENQLNRDHDITMQENAQEFEENQSAYQGMINDIEWERMYGEDGYYTNKDKQEQANWEALYGEDGLYNKGTSTTARYYGGGTLQGQDVPIELQNIPGLTTTDTTFFDANGNFKKAQLMGETPDGKMSFRINGSTVTLDKGTNPYTRTYNKDCENGTFSNGYQPNNVNGSKLTKTGEQEYVNGVLQNVWKDENGNTWVWDGTQNKYLDV